MNLHTHSAHIRVLPTNTITVKLLCPAMFIKYKFYPLTTMAI